MSENEIQAAKDWSWLGSICGKLDQDFVDAVNEESEPQDRAALQDIFE